MSVGGLSPDQPPEVPCQQRPHFQMAMLTSQEQNQYNIHIPYTESGFCICAIVLVQSFSCVRLFATPWTAAHQASLSFTILWSLLKLMSIESVMPPNHLILCRPLLLPSIFPRTRVFSNESTLCIRWPKYWSFSSSISPSNEYSEFISFRINRFDLILA